MNKNEYDNAVKNLGHYSPALYARYSMSWWRDFPLYQGKKAVPNPQDGNGFECWLLTENDKCNSVWQRRGPKLYTTDTLINTKSTGSSGYGRSKRPEHLSHRQHKGNCLSGCDNDMAWIKVTRFWHKASQCEWNLAVCSERERRQRWRSLIVN